MFENERAPHVVIVGAGFAGLNAAKALAGAPVRVTVLDARNHHLFQPLLYQVATAVLDASAIAAPIRLILRKQRNTTVLLANAQSIDIGRRRVELNRGALSYDYLVLATGSTHSYFGHPEWAEHAPGLKTIEDAIDIRHRVLLAFEAAERETSTWARRAWLTFAVVGGGPTGVELAGALAELSRESLRCEFRHIDPSEARIVLIEGLPRVLTSYPEALSQSAEEHLRQLGVEVRTRTRVTEVDPGGLNMGIERLECHTILWAAGVAASPLAQSIGSEVDKAGRVKITPELTVPGDDRVFVVGDMASLVQDGRPIPGLAPAAIQQGRHAAKNILRSVEGKGLIPFRYQDRGAFSVIGRGIAVGTLGKKLAVEGVFAWLLWALVHIFYLVGFRNRAAVLFNWGYSFLTFRRHAQLITGELREELPPLSPEHPFEVPEEQPVLH